MNLNLLRGSGSGILLNLIPKPQVRNQVWTGFGRFGNQTAASLLGRLYGLKFGRFLHAILYLPNEEVLIAILGYWMVCMALESNFRGDLDSDIRIA